MADKPHELSTFSSEISDQMAAIEDTLKEYLGGGLMPLERRATEEEQLQEWLSLTPDRIGEMIAESPAKFLKMWDQMAKLEAKYDVPGPPPPPPAPIAESPQFDPTSAMEQYEEPYAANPLEAYADPYAGAVEAPPSVMPPKEGMI